jgi:hypothetical protein
MKTMGIVLTATNKYFPLGLRLVNQWHHLYKGTMNIKFYFYSDRDPSIYLPDNCNFIYTNIQTKNWDEASLSKIYNIYNTKNDNYDYIYTIDADTLIKYYFNDYVFQNEIVACEQFFGEVAFETNENSSAFFKVEKDDIYYQTWLFGGGKEKIIEMCKVLMVWIEEDKKNNYLPAWTDENYINKYLHFNKPAYTIKKDSKIPFSISDKGNVLHTMGGKAQGPFYTITNDEYENILTQIVENKNNLWTIENDRFVKSNVGSFNYFEM